MPHFVDTAELPILKIAAGGAAWQLPAAQAAQSGWSPVEGAELRQLTQLNAICTSHPKLCEKWTRHHLRLATAAMSEDTAGFAGVVGRVRVECQAGDLSALPSSSSPFIFSVNSMAHHALAVTVSNFRSHTWRATLSSDQLSEKVTPMSLACHRLDLSFGDATNAAMCDSSIGC